MSDAVAEVPAQVVNVEPPQVETIPSMTNATPLPVENTPQMSNEENAAKEVKDLLEKTTEESEQVAPQTKDALESTKKNTPAQQIEAGKIIESIAAARSKGIVDRKIEMLTAKAEAGGVAGEAARNELTQWSKIQETVNNRAKGLDAHIEGMRKSEDPQIKFVGLDIAIALNKTNIHEATQKSQYIERQIRTKNEGKSEEEIQKLLQTNPTYAESLRSIQRLKNENKEFQEQKDALPPEVKEKSTTVSQTVAKLYEALQGKELTEEQLKAIEEDPVGVMDELISGTLGNDEEAKKLLDALIKSGVVSPEDRKNLERMFAGTGGRNLRAIMTMLYGISVLAGYIFIKNGMEGAAAK